MKKWFQRKSTETHEVDTSIVQPVDLDSTTPTGFFARLKARLSKTRYQLGDGLSQLLLGKKEIDAALLEDIEALLLQADLGIHATTAIMNTLTERLQRKQLKEGDMVYAALKAQLEALLEHPKARLATLEQFANHKPYVILMVGINGAGKTTTIGKLAKYYQQQGKKVMLAAGDTFRAAAIEQLQHWGAQNQIAVIAQHSGADSASVIYDAYEAARARGVDVLIADTAGRLHTQLHLMEELKKVKRVVQKIDASAPHETMLVLDASLGQNTLSQAREFDKAIALDSITMTKLDGTAKGGVLFAIAKELGIPFRFIGVGEGVDDLRPFDAAQFVRAIFNDDHI